MTSDTDITNAVEAWNRFNISTAQLALLQTRVAQTISTLWALGERGYLITGLRQLLSSIEGMQENRRHK